LWDETFRLRLFPHLGFLASFQASSIVVTGGGKVGSEDGAPAVDYQLSRRADFIKTFVAEQTTFNRPMVNSRDEALGAEARLHCIFWDAVMMPAANYLQFGALQLVTAMMEAGREWMLDTLLLETPIDALHTWSRDPGLTTTARLTGGQRVTALEHQEMLLDQIESFVATGVCDAAVANAAQVVAYWRETLGMLRARDEDRAARRVEWLAKRRVLQAAMSSADLDWRALEIRHLDLSFGDLNVERGVYWALLASDGVDLPPGYGDPGHYKHYPPADTRAQARTALLAQLGNESVVSVDWDEVRVRSNGHVYRVSLPDPGRSVVALNDLSAELVQRSGERPLYLAPRPI